MSVSIQQAVKRDHDEIRMTFNKYQSCQTQQSKQEYANLFIKLIAVHSVTEEMLLYPDFVSTLADGERVREHSLAEHQRVKEDLYALDKMSISDPNFDVQLKRVMAQLSDHMKEEEQDILPKYCSQKSRADLDSMGSKFEKAKHMVPSHPHPRAPNKPPMDIVAGILAMPLDKIYDAFRSFPKQREV